MQLLPWVVSLQVEAELPWYCRQASGDVSHAWLMGFVAVPSMTLFTSCETLLRVIEVTPPVRVPAPMLTNHWAKPAPLANPVLAIAFTAR